MLELSCLPFCSPIRCYMTLHATCHLSEGIWCSSIVLDNGGGSFIQNPPSPDGTINNATAIHACTCGYNTQHLFMLAGWCRPHCFFMKTMSCIFTTCCDRQTKRDAEMRTDTRGMQIVRRSDAGVINIHSNSLLLLQTYD